MQNGNNVVHPKLLLIGKTTAPVCTSAGPCVEQMVDPNPGPGSSVQALDQPGLPENPADFQR
jgi:hypothetical protein